jgi:hypothetical protein
MKEYLLLLRTQGDYCSDMEPEHHKKHVQKVCDYIEKLTREGKYKSSQPLNYDGLILHGNKGVFKDGPFIESKEVIAGYFLILAKDINEAREIAMANPVFDETDARIEIREIKHEEGIN